MRNEQNSQASGNPRLMVFIDGSNLYHVLKQNLEKTDLDYGRFSAKLAGSREWIRTYYYNIRQESRENPALAENQGRFLNALRETPYHEVKLGKWKARGGTMVEKGVDVMIATDLIKHAYEDHYDVAILVSGDADFYPAMQAVKDVGKRIEVAAFNSNMSSEAAQFADVVIEFDNSYFDDLWMSKSKKYQAQRIAESRADVTDEAASPNGEDKEASRNGESRVRRNVRTRTTSTAGARHRTGSGTRSTVARRPISVPSASSASASGGREGGPVNRRRRDDSDRDEAPEERSDEKKSPGILSRIFG